MLPDFFVIGAQKAGSTYLLRCLGEHPQVYMPPSEVAFFEDTLYDEGRLAWFESHFDPAQPGQVVGVKRPNVLGLAECPPRLRRHMPGLKLIAVLRAPVERAVSGYFHYMKTGLLPLLPIEAGMPKLLAGELAERYPRSPEVLRFGLYHQHLARYREHFPPEQLHVTLLEDIKGDPRGQLDAAYRFLGVEPGFEPPSVGSRPMAAPYSMTRLRLWNGIDRWVRDWSADGRYFNRRRDPLSRGLHTVNRGLDSQVWRRLFPADRPRLSQALQSALADYYREDTARLAELLGRPLPGWPA
ncbi:MAG: sulfotransferase domain-containing protein [Planctomycetota bacterium]